MNEPLADNPATTQTDRALMQRALELAARVPTATPNPRVGCIVVRDGEVVGEGYHRRAGEAHAEVNALEEAGDRARGATVYVTLEPCCLLGRTPPCTDALIGAGVGEVFYGMQDPNPEVAGRGLRALRDAGIRVWGPVLEEEARALNRGFVKRMQQGVPWLRCKLAMSLDGRTAMASGESRWITGPEARADVQRLRAESCAVLTGIGTVLADDPSLNVRAEQLALPRAEELAERQPLRVILDSSLRTPPDSRIINLPGQALVFTTVSDPSQRARLEQRGVTLHPQTGQRVDAERVLRTLAQEYDCNEVLLEAGPTLCGALVSAGLVDEVVIYVGASFLGDEAMPLLRLPGLSRMAQRVRLRFRGLARIGEDCRIEADLVTGSDDSGATDA